MKTGTLRLRKEITHTEQRIQRLVCKIISVLGNEMLGKTGPMEQPDPVWRMLLLSVQNKLVQNIFDKK